jgi:hypothetical protein
MSNEHESGDDRRERQCEKDLKAKIDVVTKERDLLKALLAEAFPYLKQQAAPPETLVQRIRDVFLAAAFKSE